MDSSPSPLMEEGDSIESNGSFIIRKLKSQLKAANMQIEHLKSDNFSMKEQNLKLKKYYDQMINYKTKCQLLLQTNEQLNIQNQNLMKQMKMESKSNQKLHSNKKIIDKKEYKRVDNDLKNPFDQSNKEMNMKIAKLIEQHKIEIDLRDNIIKKLQNQVGQTQDNKLEIVTDLQPKQNRRRIHESDYNEKRAEESDYYKMREENEKLKRKYRNYYKRNKELEEENGKLLNQIKSMKQATKDNDTNAIREVIEKENRERKIRELEALLAEERDKYYIYKEKATKYELELKELKNLISIVAENENKLLEMGVNKADIYNEILGKGGDIDEIGCFAAFGNALHKKINQNPPKKKK